MKNTSFNIEEWLNTTVNENIETVYDQKNVLVVISSLQRNVHIIPTEFSVPYAY